MVRRALLVFLLALSGLSVHGDGSIRVEQVENLDPQQEEENSIGILNTIFTNNVGPTTTRGLLIDAGSGGSRIHVYEWGPRVFNEVPPPISFPTTNELYTGRISDGVQLAWRENQTEEDLMEKLESHFAPLIDFARSNLKDMEDQFATIPIWFKATGGVRELAPTARIALTNGIRKLLSDKTFNPFYFHYSMARVISGEEEAVFSWACMNFLFGNLIPESEGLGSVTGSSNMSQSFGTLDLGGSSTQIAFYLPSEDIMEGLYKLQIGGQKHWNVYTKSFLKFGITSARRRHFQYLAVLSIQRAHLSANGDVDSGVPPISISEARNVLAEMGSDAAPLSLQNPCFPSGFKETTRNLPEIQVDLEMYAADEESGGSGSNGAPYDYTHWPKGEQGHFEACRAVVSPLMEKNDNDYCDQAYHGDCSIGGQYQPALPTMQHFMGTSSYKVPWSIMRLPRNTSLAVMKERARQVCDMTYAQTQQYIRDFNITAEKSSPAYFCFDSVYTIVLLEEGYGFQPNMTITVLDTVNGNKVGWPLGAILHEINNLPWELVDPFDRTPWGKYVLACLLGIIIGAVTAFSVSNELHMDDTRGLGATGGRSKGYESVNGSRSPSTDVGASPYRAASRGRTDTNTIQMVPLRHNGSSSRGELSPDRRSDASSPGTNWQDKISQYVPLFKSNASNSNISDGSSYQALDSTERTETP